jgi:hypothetical protein
LIYRYISERLKNAGGAGANVEPSDAASGLPQPAFMFTTTQLLDPIQWPAPVLRFGTAKIVFLLVKIGCYVVTHKREEAHSSVGGVAFTDKFPVNRTAEEKVGEERGPSIDRDDSEDAYDVFLFP